MVVEIGGNELMGALVVLNVIIPGFKVDPGRRAAMPRMHHIVAPVASMCSRRRDYF